MTNKDYTHLAFVVDRSGSMRGIHTDMNGAILKMLDDQAAEPGHVVVDITTFDNLIEKPYGGVAPADVKGDVIVPRGTTALNDAIGITIQDLGVNLALMDEDDRPGTVIVVVVTDGMENASREYNSKQIKEMVTEQTEKWGWQFVYLAANVDAFATGGDLGFARGSTIAYAATSVGTQSVYDATSRNISRSRATGQSISFSESDRDAAMDE